MDTLCCQVYFSGYVNRVEKKKGARKVSDDILREKLAAKEEEGEIEVELTRERELEHMQIQGTFWTCSHRQSTGEQNSFNFLFQYLPISA